MFIENKLGQNHLHALRIPVVIADFSVPTAFFLTISTSLPQQTLRLAPLNGRVTHMLPTLRLSVAAKWFGQPIRHRISQVLNVSSHASITTHVFISVPAQISSNFLHLSSIRF